MVRIGRQIPHYKTIDEFSIEAAFSSDKKYRYLLSMKYANTLLDSERDKSIAVIMKNPSAADEKKADATIRKVETFVYNRFLDVRQLHILNIFAFRATEPADLNQAFDVGDAMEVIGTENDRIIRNTLAEMDYIILAWGNTSGIDKTMYEERIYRVKMMMEEVSRHKIFTITGRTKTKHPLHGLMWGYDYDIKPIDEFQGQQ